MSWHYPPHMPECGDRIIAQYKGCKSGNNFELCIRQMEGFSHIERWCYLEDFKEIKEREIREKNFRF